jgi:hypothetical protein
MSKMLEGSWPSSKGIAAASPPAARLSPCSPLYRCQTGHFHPLLELLTSCSEDFIWHMGDTSWICGLWVGGWVNSSPGYSAGLSIWPWPAAEPAKCLADFGSPLPGWDPYNEQLTVISARPTGGSGA